MPKESNTINLAVGLALLAAACLLAWWGYSESRSLANQLSRAFSGTHSDRVMWKYIGGAVCAVAGLVLVARK